MADANTCPDCGAVLPEDAERCTLCGTAVTDDAARSEEDAESVENPPAETVSDASDGESAVDDPPSARAEAAASGAFCNECGWQNPPGANFCSRCGHRLQSVEQASGAREDDAAPAGTRPAEGPSSLSSSTSEAARASSSTPSAGDDGLTRRVVTVIGVAVLLVAVLFVWSSMSDGGQQGTEAPGGSQAAVAGARGAGPGGMGGGPAGEAGDAVPDIVLETERGPLALPDSLAGRADSLRTVVEEREGRHRRLARRQLARLYTEAGLRDRAAVQQWFLAREIGNDPEAWERAGVFLYDWMTTLRQGQDPARTAQVARLTTDAYERFLQAQPGNHDARTDLAVAYLFTNNPMRGISEIRRVLEEAPDHVGARFNFGLMQRMIGRNATALAQFERVRELTDEASPYYEQAGLLIEEINQEASGDPQDTPMPGSGSGPAVGVPGS